MNTQWFETKKCEACGVDQPLEAFHRTPRNLSLLQSKCRHCQPRYRQGGKPERAKKRAWQRNNREKRAAHKAVESAIARGALVRQPCERCGDAVGINAHHEDYSRHLDVMWLCHKHHHERHKEIGRPIGGVRIARHKTLIMGTLAGYHLTSVEIASHPEEPA